MDILSLLADLHARNQRQGPGGELETQTAIRLAGLSAGRDLAVADIGCGTGAASLVLARVLNAHVTAVDLIPEFLQTLDVRATDAGMEHRVSTLHAPMDALPFEESSFDVIWSEGAVYIMGFEAGISYWKRFLKPGGVLAVSEITWLTTDRPTEIDDHWRGEYPEIDTASAKIAALERTGYIPTGYFFLPEYCWLDNYYRPLQGSFQSFLADHGRSEEAKQIVEGERQEIALYERYRNYYSYGFYIAQKPF